MGDELLGLAVLLAAALAGVALLLPVLIAAEARRPPRRTAGYAVARGMPVDPGDIDLEFEAWTLEAAGAALPVWEIRGRAPSGPTAVLVHDWGGSRIEMLGRLRPWEELAARVVLYDRRGHGDARSGRARLGRAEAADLCLLLDRLGPGPFVLAGEGMGAAVAVGAAALHDRVVGVVARRPVLDMGAWLADRLAAAGRPLVDLAAIWLRLTGGRFIDVEGAAARLRCPLLVVAGEGGPDAEALRRFLARCLQCEPASSAAYSGPRWRSNRAWRPTEVR